MKNQNDLIALIVSVVFTLVGCILATVYARVPATPPPPATVATSDAPLPTEAPVMAPALPQPASKSGGNGGLPGFGNRLGGVK